MRTPLLEELEIMLSAAIYWDGEEDGKEHVSELLSDAYANVLASIKAAKKGDACSLVSREEEGGAL